MALSIQVTKLKKKKKKKFTNTNWEPFHQLSYLLLIWYPRPPNLCTLSHARITPSSLNKKSSINLLIMNGKVWLVGVHIHGSFWPHQSSPKECILKARGGGTIICCIMYKPNTTMSCDTPFLCRGIHFRFSRQKYWQWISWFWRKYNLLTEVIICVHT